MEPLAQPEPIADTSLFDNHAKGCILGAFVGDATGTYNEFGMNELDEEEL